jgi:hypothetical protein
MLFLKGNLIDTFSVVLVGNLPPPPQTKNLFLLKLRSLLRGLWVLVALFIPFPSWNGLLWRWLNSSNKKGVILNHHEKSLKIQKNFLWRRFFFSRYCIAIFSQKHLKTYPDLSLELETTLEMSPNHTFPCIWKIASFSGTAHFLWRTLYHNCNPLPMAALLVRSIASSCYYYSATGQRKLNTLWAAAREQPWDDILADGKGFPKYRKHARAAILNGHLRSKNWKNWLLKYLLLRTIKSF